jgi:hypothetical protein
VLVAALAGHTNQLVERAAQVVEVTVVLSTILEQVELQTQAVAVAALEEILVELLALVVLVL